MGKVAQLTIQQWGNSLAVRIPSAIARSVHFAVGQPVEVMVQEDGLTVKSLGEPRLTLAQKLELFDPSTHGGEAMPTGRLGAEVV